MMRKLNPSLAFGFISIGLYTLSFFTHNELLFELLFFFFWLILLIFWYICEKYYMKDEREGKEICQVQKDMQE